MKVNYSYNAKSTFETSNEVGLTIKSGCECSSSNECILKGEVAIEILKSLHKQGIIRFAYATIPNEENEEIIKIV